MPTARGNDATLTATTTPGASCSIVINYKSGPSNARGLETKTGDVNGRVSWTWKVGPLTTPGSYRIDVIAVLGDDRVTARTWFKVKDTGNPGYTSTSSRQLDQPSSITSINVKRLIS